MIWNLLLVLMLGIGIALYEVPKLREQEMRRELLAFWCLLLVAVALAVALVLRLPVPNPTRGIEIIFGPFIRLLYPAGLT